MHWFYFDAPHDEIVVMSPLAQAILTFRGAANGEEPPIRVIQGPHTQIRGTPYGGAAIVTVDPVNNEIYVPVIPDQLLVFDRNANGDVAPKRILSGKGGAIDISGQTGVAVDPVHNLLLLNGRNSIFIFDRTASGDEKPKAVIRRPNRRKGNVYEFYVK